MTSRDRKLRSTICQWLLAAEREYRLALGAVQQDGSNVARARFAAARLELDAATKATEQLVVWRSGGVPTS